MSGNPIPRIPNAPLDYNQSSTQQILSIIQTALEELRRRGVAHEQSDDPHPQYTTQTEVDASVTAHETTYDHGAYDSHVASTSNPHSVTAAQVGADPSGTAATEVATHEAAADPHAQYAELAGGASADFTAMPLVGGDAIVEEGSNANGYYTRFSSGLLIMYAVVTYPAGDTDGLTITLPDTLISVASATVTAAPREFSSSALASMCNCEARIASTTTADVKVGIITGSALNATTLDVGVSVQVLGRWK